MPVVKQLLAEIKNQFLVTPKCLGIDNALEFVQNDFQSLYTSLDIIHQITCPHTSQQNDATERKHRHILDVACTSMMQFSLHPI